MTAPDRDFSDVLEVELTAHDLKMIQIIGNRGFLTDEDRNQFLPLEPNAGARVFRLTRGCLMYIAFGLQTTIEEVKDEHIQETLKQTFDKVWPHLEGLAEGAEHLEDDYADGL